MALSEGGLLALAGLICSTIGVIYTKYVHIKLNNICKDCKYSFEPKEELKTGDYTPTIKI